MNQIVAPGWDCTIRPFYEMSDAEAADFLQSKVGELGADITAEDILEKVNAGRAVIVKRAEALAVVQPEDDAVDQIQMHLWLLWVSPNARGRGFGKRVVRDLIKTYTTIRWARLICFGPARAKFFGRCGFKVVERFGDEAVGQWSSAVDGPVLAHRAPEQPAGCPSKMLKQFLGSLGR